MATTEGKDKEGTAIYRLARETGFSARVEPVWYNLSKVKKKMGWFEYLREKSRIKRIIQTINDTLLARGADPQGWDREEGECVCHLRVERLGFLEDLRRFVREGLPPNVAKGLVHLLNSREKHAMYIPVDLERPLLVSDGKAQIPVGSSIHLARELKTVDQYLQIEREFALAKMSNANYINASERDVAALESKAMFDALFWTKFGYMVIKKLADMGVEHKLPVIFS